MRHRNPAASPAILRLPRKLKKCSLALPYSDRPKVLSNIQPITGQTIVAVELLVRQHRNLFRNRSGRTLHCNLLVPDCIISFDANSWTQSDSLFDDLPFQPRLGPLLRPASVALSPQATAHSQGSSSL